ncbi:MAG: Carbon monoxide dehydrogenase medium chain [Candidatus Moanabacter tarae]|uniref:Carbon monoxide dehydrogenase medium chain n=1 Tax=Candidatus Moanibacter tarae TaxID=2200854 RepID=A0A2Z4ANI5_9BACT|nr:MAG: Carbon monoxide dehydrogenase medium chain [Candidatus Moanabacter tarae]|tara:strand:- start:2751 stop:3662 length:912 start_codon:yes stop_codon:yes gene_type:complete
MKDFQFCSPRSLDEAVGLMSEEGVKARGFAGGTDVLVQLRAKRFEIDRLVDMKQVPELNDLQLESTKGLRIGASVPCHQVYEDKSICSVYPGLIDSIAIIGGIQIQGRASIGGNLCNASPSADSIPTLIVYGAQCEIAGKNGMRSIGVEDFCVGPGKSVLDEGEILVAVNIPTPAPNSGAHYLRFIPRNEMDIAVVGAGAAVELEEDLQTIKKARIAFGAVAPTPLLASEAGDLLSGKEAGEESYEAAASVAQSIVSPITDMRGTKEFRIHLTGVLTKRALRGAVARARGEFVPNAVEEAKAS